MSLLISLAGATNDTAYIEKPVAMLIFDLRVTKTDLVAATTYAAKTTLPGVLNNVTVKVITRTKEGGEHVQFNDIPLDVLLESQNAAGQGHVSIEDIDGTNYSIRAALDLSNTGCIPFSNDEEMEVKITNGDADIDNVYVYDLESAEFAQDYKKVERHNMNNGQLEKELDVSKADTLIFPLASFTSNLELALNYTNGVVQRFNDKAELEVLAYSGNDCMYNFNGMQVGGFCAYAVLNVKNVESISISRTATSAFSIYVERNMVLPDVSTTMVKNARIIDTNDATREAILEQRVREATKKVGVQRKLGIKM